LTSRRGSGSLPCSTSSLDGLLLAACREKLLLRSALSTGANLTPAVLNTFRHARTPRLLSTALLLRPLAGLRYGIHATAALARHGLIVTFCSQRWRGTRDVWRNILRKRCEQRRFCLLARWRTLAAEWVSGALPRILPGPSAHARAGSTWTRTARRGRDTYTG